MNQFQYFEKSFKDVILNIHRNALIQLSRYKQKD